MALTSTAENGIVDDFAAKLTDGFLAIYEHEPVPETQEVPLVVQPLAGFQPADQRVAVSHELSPTVIQRTGTAKWAQLVSSTGEVFSIVRVRQMDDPQAEAGDVLVERLDFHQGGLLTLARLTVTVP